MLSAKSLFKSMLLCGIHIAGDPAGCPVLPYVTAAMISLTAMDIFSPFDRLRVQEGQL